MDASISTRTRSGASKRKAENLFSPHATAGTIQPVGGSGAASLPIRPTAGAGAAGLPIPPTAGAGAGASRFPVRPVGDSSGKHARPPLPPSPATASSHFSPVAAAPVVSPVRAAVVVAAPVPTLHDFLASPRDAAASDSPPAFLDAAVAWPSTRLDILATIEREIERRIPGETFLDDVRTVFAVKRRLASGASGVVYKACLNDAEALGMVAGRKVCQKFAFPSADSSGRFHQVPLVLKNMAKQATDDLPADASAAVSCVSRGGECTGYDNMVREALMGRFLNLLVRKKVTPHLPVIYKCFGSRFMETEPLRASTPAAVRVALEELLRDETSAASIAYRSDRKMLDLMKRYKPRYVFRQRCGAIATEMCHMTFVRFLTTIARDCRTVKDTKRLLKVAFVQLVHGIMSAQHYLNFRHNDFHTQNAMMTYITSGVYQYVVDGVQYDVPNYGMCWKLIDFGFSSSTELFGCYDNGTMLACSHALSVAETYDLDPAEHASEMYDLVRFMTLAKNFAIDESTDVGVLADQSARWSVIALFFQKQLATSTKVFEDMNPDSRTRASRSLEPAVAVGSRAARASHAQRVGYAKLATSNAKTNTMRTFFKKVAESWRVGVRTHGPNVFDADEPLFRGGEPLEAFESRYYGVDVDGKLVPRVAPAVIA